MFKSYAKRLLAAVLAMVTLASMFTFAANAATNLAVIYYRGYTSPYIHYQTSSGSWTTAPGYAMEKNNEVEGYTHKYTINLGSKTSTKLCFNNGGGTWDNNNSQDYTAKTGNNYFVTKGNFVSTLKAGITVNKTTADVNESISFTASGSGGYTDYQYKFTFTNLDTNKVTETKYSSSIGYSQAFAEEGNYKATVSVKDYAGTVATNSVNFTVESKEFKVTSFEVTPVKNVGLYEFANMKVNAVGGTGQYFYKYTYSIYGQEHIIYDYSQASQASYQFANMGTYTINVYVKDGIGAAPVKLSQQFVVNQTYVYKLDADKTTVKQGETVKITPTMYNEASVIKPEHYFYSVTDENGNVETLTTSSDKTLSWTPKVAGTYKVRLDVKYAGKTIAFNTIDITVEEDVLRVESFEATPTKNVGMFEYVKMKVVAAGGGGTKADDYYYKYTYTIYGQERVLYDYSKADQITWQFPETGTYTLNVYVKASSVGTPIQASTKVTINQTYVYDLKADKTSAHVGETIKIIPTMLNEASVVTASDYVYTVTKDGVTQTIKTNSDKTGSWTPTEAGEYTVRLDVTHNGKCLGLKSFTYKVEEKPANTVTIYYKGYSTPYIHYQIQGKSWTAVPGMKMLSSTVVDGYKHEYTIDLGTATYVNVCFNDGKNSWDSKNGANYKFTAGTYTYYNGKITPYEPSLKIKSFDITPANGVINENESVKMNVTMTDPNATFMAQFAYRDSKGNEQVIYDYAYANGCSKQFTQAGTYTLIVRVKENPYSTEILTAEKTVTVKAVPKFAIKSFTIDPADGVVTAMESVKMRLEMEDSTKSYLAQFVCINDETGYEEIVYDYAYAVAGSKQFTRPGKYTLMVRVKENPYSTEILTASQKVTVLPQELQITSFNIDPEDGVINVNESVNISISTNYTTYMTQFAYRDSKGNETVIYDYAYARGCSKQFTQAGTYTLIVRVKESPYSTDIVTAEKTITVKEAAGFAIKSFTIDPADGIVTAMESVKMKLEMEDSSKSYLAQFVCIDEKGNETVVYDYAYAVSGSKQFTQPGTYTLMVRVKENPYSTEILTASKKVTVLPKKLAIKSFDITPADGVINENESVKMTVAMTDPDATFMAQFAYRDSKGNEQVIYDYAYASGCSKQFTQAGTYTLIVRVKENPYSTEILTAEKTVTVKAVPKFAIKSFDIDPADGKVNVFDSVKMTLEMEDSSKSYLAQFVCIDEKGNETVVYDYAYAVSGSKQFTQPGTYTLMVRVKENPYSTEILTASKTVTVVAPKTNNVTIYYKGYSTPYIHYQVAGKNWTTAPGVKMTATSEVAGYTHKAVIDLGTATYANVCFNNGSGSWDSNNGKNYKFNAGTYTFSGGKIEEYDSNAMKVTFNISPSNGVINVNDSVNMSVTVSNVSTYVVQYAYRDANGNEYTIYDYTYASSGSKQFTKAGTYTLIARVKESFGSTEVITVEKTITVQDPTANTITIYYKGYSTPYIHYQVGNGSWTTAPGVKMTETSEKAGYTHKVTIDLGSASYANVCFNDGKGNWDSKNGANYKFYAGTYTFANGKYTKI